MIVHNLSIALVVVLFLALAAEFTNGVTDAANAIATVISTRVLSPTRAVIMAGTLNLVGVLVTGTAVATTIGTGIVKPEVIGLHTIAAALLTIIIWSWVAWRFGIPTSETHEMVAGLAGAGLATAGTSVLLWDGWRKVLLGLGISTVAGFALGFIVMLSIYWLFRRATYSKVRSAFGRLQIVSAAFMAFSHGSNDGQKFMGIFTMALYIGGILPSFFVPWWVVILCGAVMAIGTATGGWRIIKTMGFGITRLDPVQGFAAETSASIAILVASSFGIPLSTTHSISATIMGVGSTRRLSAVKWGTTRSIFMTWIITFPVCFVIGYVLTLITKPIMT
ncbi:MAG: inorganic phosphate transporter [Dehalococcoidia bacterium]|nr:inorganic phosphate transporter [Dehalococcoidia bacterium]MDH4367047.1 inorganic phosphate transporter [Dehalococcoidia bacterium]